MKNDKDEKLSELFSAYTSEEKSPDISATNKAKEYMNKTRVAEKATVTAAETAGGSSVGSGGGVNNRKKTMITVAVAVFLIALAIVYTGSAQELVTAGAANGGTLNYKLGDGEWGTTIPAATDAGDYKVYYKVVGDGSHSDTAETEIPVTIAKANAAFTAAPQDPDLSYKGEAQALVTAGVTDDGTVEYKLGDGEWYERYLTRRKARSGKDLIICRVALCSAS